MRPLPLRWRGSGSRTRHQAVIEVVEGVEDGLMEFALFALDHALASVVASGGPLVPFCLIDVGGEQTIRRFVGDLESGQERARAAVREAAEVNRAAVAWDGYVTVEGVRSDAVLVEASASGSDSVTVAHRYGRKGRIRKDIEQIGNAALIRTGGAPLF
jgi:hypothetical protein